MNENIEYQWGPKDRLGQRIAQVPYHRPDASLTARIMSQLKPKRPGRVLRLLAWLRSPVTVTLSPALAALVLLFICLPAGVMVYDWKSSDGTRTAALQQAAGIPVTFDFDSASANSVAVMGSFNNWDPKGYEMRRQQDSGTWSIEVQLSPGRHDYAFLVDGEKISPDPDADLIQKDDYGNRNSVKFVKGGHGQRI